MKTRPFLTTTLCAALVAPSFASAQAAETAAAITRVEQLSEDSALSAACKDHGYLISEAGLDESVKRAVGAAYAVGVDDAAISKAIKVGNERGMKVLEAGVDKMSASADTEAFKAAVRLWADDGDARCARIAAGPAGATPITAPAGFDRAAGKVRAMDMFLEPLGLASWQTPRIALIGQFAYLVGNCRSRLGERKAKAMLAPFVGKTKANDKSAPRDQRFYAQSYEAGVEDAREAQMTKEDCAALVAPPHAA